MRSNQCRRRPARAVRVPAPAALWNCGRTLCQAGHKAGRIPWRNRVASAWSLRAMRHSIAAILLIGPMVMSFGGFDRRRLWNLAWIARSSTSSGGLRLCRRATWSARPRHWARPRRGSNCRHVLATFRSSLSPDGHAAVPGETALQKAKHQPADAEHQSPSEGDLHQAPPASAGTDERVDRHGVHEQSGQR